MSELQPGQRYRVTGPIRLAIDVATPQGSLNICIMKPEGFERMDPERYQNYGITRKIHELSTSITIDTKAIESGVTLSIMANDEAPNPNMLITNMDDDRYIVPHKWLRDGNSVVEALRIYQEDGEWKMEVCPEQ